MFWSLIIEFNSDISQVGSYLNFFLPSYKFISFCDMYLIGKTIRKLAKISFFVDFCIMQIETSRLKNGIRIVHACMDLPVSYCGIAINTGTRDQLPQQSGMAHFVEHTLFQRNDSSNSRTNLEST